MADGDGTSSQLQTRGRIPFAIRRKQRAVIEFLTAEKAKPASIYCRLKAVYGNDCVDISTVRRWSRRLADPSTDRRDAGLGDAPRSGRPRTATTAACHSRVDQLIRENRRISQGSLAEKLHVSRDRVHVIVRKLGYRRVCATWVPKLLTAEMKERRKRAARELLARHGREGNRFTGTLITADETWVRHYEPETRRESMEYRHPESPRPKKLKISRSSNKLMLSVFWDARGVIHSEYAPKGTTINSTRYIETLKRLKNRVRRVRPDTQQLVLQHDNARPHVSASTTEAVKRLNIEVVTHPPYSPDLAPCDYHMFPKLKEHLRGRQFSSDEEVKECVRHWLRALPASFFSDGFDKLVQRWQTCLDRDGDYVE